MSGATVRLDAWVWAVRMAKTRTAATDAVKAGRVRLDGAAVKASTKVSVGDRVEVRRGAWRLEVEVEVVELRSKRVGAPLAEASYRVLAEDRPEPAGTAAAGSTRSWRRASDQAGQAADRPMAPRDRRGVNPRWAAAPWSMTLVGAQTGIVTRWRRSAPAPMLRPSW